MRLRLDYQCLTPVRLGYSNHCLAQQLARAVVRSPQLLPKTIVAPYAKLGRMSSAPVARDPQAADVDAVTDAVLTASRLLMSISARSIAAVDESITIPQFRLLVVLHARGPVNLTAIADALAVNPSTATRMVERLVTTGLVSRQANPSSRRELVVDLTDRGRSTVRDVMRRRRTHVSRIVTRMTPTARRNLVRALSAFTTAGGTTTTDSDILWL